MIIKSNQYPKAAEVHKHDGTGAFHTETIVTKEQLGKAGRLFVRGTLKSGDSVGMHSHPKDMEICYFISGSGLVRDDDSEITVSAGDSNIVLPGHRHEVVNTGKEDLVYLAAVVFPV